MTIVENICLKDKPNLIKNAIIKKRRLLSEQPKKQLQRKTEKNFFLHKNFFVDVLRLTGKTTLEDIILNNNRQVIVPICLAGTKP